MSAHFIAHVERPDGRVHHIDCDAAHENDAGRLALTINTYVGAIAAYAPGAWASYRLEAPPDAVQRGNSVHVRNAEGVCLPGIVEDIDGDLLQIDTFGADPRFSRSLSRSHDETRRIDGSWHWPHDDEQPVEQDPDASGPVTVNVDFRGLTWTSEQADEFVREFAKQQRQRPLGQ